MKGVTGTVTGNGEQEYFVGLDLHKKFMQAAIMDSDGTVLQNKRIECDYNIIKKEFAKFPKDAKYVMESSSVWYGMYRFLSDQLSLDVMLSNPRTTKVIAESKKKTDKVDARILADLLRCGYISESHVPNKETVEMRQLVRHRAKMVKERTRFKNLIHGILLQNGIKINKVPFSAEFIRMLHKLDNWRIEDYLETISHLSVHIDDCDARIKKEVSKRHAAKLLTTIPGVGNITALALVAEIDDVSRFSSMDKLASYFGIVPSVRNSAETVKHGRITRTGNSMVRHLLAEAVIVHCTFAKKKEKDTPISTFYQRLAKKRGGSKAKVAASAKMLHIIYWMLVKDLDFWTCVEEGKKITYLHAQQKQNGSRKVKKS